MKVIEHYTGCKVPYEDKYANWFIWEQNVLDHPAVKATREPKEKLIAHYKKYVDHKTKNHHWKRFIYEYNYGEGRFREDPWLKDEREAYHNPEV